MIDWVCMRRGSTRRLERGGERLLAELQQVNFASAEHLEYPEQRLNPFIPSSKRRSRSLLAIYYSIPRRASIYDIPQTLAIQLASSPPLQLPGEAIHPNRVDAVAATYL
jgi:hypothetical protein